MSWPTFATVVGQAVVLPDGTRFGPALCADVDLWTPDPATYGCLREYLDVERFRELLPEAGGLEARRYELPNLCAQNFVVVGLLGLGVAALTGPTRGPSASASIFGPGKSKSLSSSCIHATKCGQASMSQPPGRPAAVSTERSFAHAATARHAVTA